MKTLHLTLLAIGVALVPQAQAQKGTLVFPAPPAVKPEPPPRVWVAPGHENQPDPAPLLEGPAYAYNRKPATGAYIISPEDAQKIITRFRQQKAGHARYFIFVNRQESSAGNASPGSTGKTPIDAQTAQEVEALFGKPLQAAGAVVADPQAAAQVIGDKSLVEVITTSNSPRIREALAKIADAAIEIVVSPTVAPSGDQTVPAATLQATAIQLSDSRVLGQAASSELTSGAAPAPLDAKDLSETTALALMRNMTPK
jgi:hypothetical protein